NFLQELPRLKLGTGLSSVEAKLADVIIIEDTARDPRVPPLLLREGITSAAYIALRSRDKVLGSMFIAKRYSQHKFSPADTELLRAIGNKIASAVENAVLFEKVSKLSIVDELTGLYNRRHFYNVLETESYRTGRDGHPFSLVMLDLNGFKGYNDGFGHAYGDAVLKSLAQTLRETVRKTDTAFRYGGDEFTIILPAMDADRAKKIVDRIRSKWLQIAEAEYPIYPIPDTPLGFSAGIAQFPENAETVDGLVFVADVALYHSKRSGGYKCTLARDLAMLPPEILSMATMDQVNALAATVDAKHPHTHSHSKRVTAISEMIGKALGLSNRELADLHAISLLHDIGKVGVPDSILAKPDKLTEQEWEIIKKHSLEGARIVSYVKEMEALVPLMRHHHEWYDGTGYPDGLKGEDIPLGARIISLADAYDTMTTSHPYKLTMSKEQALEELIRCSGTQFDPKLVEVLCRTITEAAN
ncbi:MAG TPA: HD domain-containing phosphohydrolase, partial [Dehalococcoidia bacterium]|nr:HD domain-containing phosphohydrolase [Dehalococcoidia bacterium]